jgi:hypothetical protein
VIDLLGYCVNSTNDLHPVQDFGVIPGLVNHAIEDVLKCNPAEHPILCTEPAWNTPANRERMAEIMFEELNAPAFYIANSGVLNAYATFAVNEALNGADFFLLC